MTSPLHYRPDIDGLRAVAVLLVVAFHTFPSMAPGGFVGVDVFFVISGYLISGIIMKGLQEGSFRITDFYARRVRRIFPALAIVLGTCLVLGWIFLTPEEYAPIGLHSFSGTLFVSNFLLWSESGYFGQLAQAKPLLHLWSLGVEEQFYILWPWFLVRWRSTPGMVGMVVVASFLASILLAELRPVAAFYSPITRFWELLVGGLWAQLAALGKSPEGPSGLRRWPVAFASSGIADGLSVAGLTLIGVAALGFSELSPFPGWRALVPVSGAIAIVASGPDAFINRTVLSRRALVLMGLISYPLYLWHWPLLVFLRQLDFETLPAGSRLVRLGALAVAASLSYLTYRFVEIRVRSARNAVGPLCALMAVVSGLGLAVTLSRGAELRLRADQQAVAATARRSQEDAPRAFRLGTCFLRPEQDEHAFSADCIEATGTGGKSVLLWGDSHAAHLYSGVRAVTEGRNLRLSQLAASSCPPILSYSSKEMPHCESINRHIMAWVRSNRPNTVVLAADWQHYPEYLGVEDTIRALRSSGTSSVVVVGPVAVFPKPQPTLVIRHSMNGPVPERVANPRLVELQILNAKLRLQSSRAGAEFVSPLDSICNKEGCIVAIDGRPELLVSFDLSHLTRAGSEFVARATLCATSSACDH